MSDDSAIEFPCRFPIKIMGHATETFDVEVVAIVRRHCPDLAEGSVRTRASKEGRYVSVTVTVMATSQAQLDAIYQDLTASELVLMAL